MTILLQTSELADSILQVPLDQWREFNWRDAIDLVALTRTGLRVAVIFLLAWLAYRVLRMLLRRLERNAGEADPSSISLHEQRIHTLVSLLRSIGVVFILVIALFMTLDAVGVPIGPLLASAGVLGLAFSFGAQSLVKDVISGLFILFENQFGVGDVIRIGDVAGRVEKVTLRIVIMRDVQGVVHIVPNGEIKQVSNLTRAFSRAVLDIGVAYKENVDHVIEVMRDIGQQLWEDAEWRPLLSEELKVLGVEGFADSAVTIRMIATTLPLKQWDVARELRRRIKNRFDAEGIEIPFPHHTVYWGEGQKPSVPRSTVDGVGQPASDET